MYINGRKLEVRRYSSGELKFIKSELDDYVVNNTVKKDRARVIVTIRFFIRIVRYGAL